MAKKMKDIIKKNPIANATFGTDPSNPWATKYNVTEATETELLARYLNSRGVNPRFVTRDTKIAHAKSSEYAKWKADHIERFAREETQIKENDTSEKNEMVQAQLHFIKYACEEILDYIDKGGEVEEWYQVKIAKSFSEFESLHSFMEGEARRLGLKEGLSEAKKPKPTALDKFRKAAAEREKKHAEIEKKQSKDGSGMTASIDRLEKHLNKEEAEQIDEKNVPTSPEKWARAKAAAKSKFAVYPSAYANGWASKKYKAMGGGWKSVKEETEQLDEVSSSEVEHHFNNWSNSEHAPYNSDAGDDNKVHQSALRYLRSTNVPKEKHEKMAMHIAHKFHGSGIDEEVEQIDELKKSTVFSWLKKQPVVPEKKPGMSRKDHNKKIKTSSKSWNRALDRLAGYKPTSEAVGVSKTKETQFHKKLDSLVHNTFGKRKGELKMKEDVFQDPQSATQMNFDGANNTNDTSLKREMSKSARIIKTIYKRKNMKEDMNDWEKEDKSVQSYGKKPKLDMTDKKDNVGENKPEARAVMAGGKTLTGQPRDMVEIDPSMKNRPDRPDTFDKGNPKKSPA